ncbi:MAG: hypothetical protein HN368_16590 [Spirochaetales bacterium]|nr:hypothetical protein [Spirochaetales bacterium]
MANNVHYPSLASFDDAEIVGLCERDRGRLDSTADKYGIAEERRYFSEGYDDYQNMLEELKPDGVYVIGQPHIMYDIWNWCLDN